MRLLALALLAGLANTACDSARPPAQTDVQVPKIALAGRVIDKANVLEPADEQGLASVSEQLEKRTTDQLVIVTLESLNGASIEQVGYALGNVWGVGRKDLNNGVLLLLVPSEQRVRIEVGVGLEGLLTDERAANIVRNMLPSFRSGSYAAGINRGATDIATLLQSDGRRPQPKVAA